MASKVTLDGKLLFPSDYLAAVEFQGRDVTLTIKSVAKEELKMRGGVSEVRPVLQFVETKKKLVCNKTNADSIAQMYGTEAKNWPGNRITLYPTKTQCGRETVDCIRVREKVPAAAAQQATTPSPNPAPMPSEPSEEEKAAIVAQEKADAFGGDMF